MKPLSLLLTATAWILSANSMQAQAKEPPNILFIGVDDLNCDFGAYGNELIHSPNMDELASDGVLFGNNHSQKAVSGPSRASLLSGWTPEHTGITSFRQYLRDMYPDVVTLPQFFKNKGYSTVGMGKIHDPRNVSVDDEVDLVSWTQWVEVNKNRYVSATDKPVTECLDVTDDAYTDGRLAQNAVDQISQLAGQDDPFFLAVGFKKPHLPFTAPKKYWDIYNREKIPLAPYRRHATNDEDYPYNPGNEFRNYDDVPQEGSFEEATQKKYIHGYYACVSYIDAQVGKLIDQLKTEGIYDSTIIVLWGDHGFHLGDHRNWGKHTAMEGATQCPLIICGPGIQKDKITYSPSALLDLYPTLADISGFSVPDTLDGNSLKPILQGKQEQVQAFAMSQFSRSGNTGYALRSNYYRYVEWRDNGTIAHQQLFNYVNDPYETQNLSVSSDYQVLMDTLSQRIEQYRQHGENHPPLEITSDTDSLDIYPIFHKVSFELYQSVNGTISPFEGLPVQMDNKYSTPANSNGQTFIKLRPGNHTYHLEKETYGTEQGSLDLTGDTTVVDTLVKEFFYTHFTLIDQYTGKPLYGIAVTLDSLEKESGVEGKATFSVRKGTYDITLSDPEYASYQGTIEVEKDTSITLALTPLYGDIEFTLLEDATPVNDALIRLDGQEQYTNSLGMTTFKDQDAKETYEYRVTKDGYYDRHDSVTLRADTNITIDMEKVTHQVDCWISDRYSEERLDSCSIELDDFLELTDTNGMASFDVTPGTYDYSVEKTGYQKDAGSLEVNSDTSFQFYLNPAVASATFHVEQGEDPLSGVTIEMDGRSRETNATGDAAFDNLATDTTYSWTLSKTGYNPFDSSVHVTHDTTLVVKLQKVTAILPDNRTKEVQVYPNPARDHLIVETGFAISGLTIFNSAGQVILRENNINRSRITLDMPSVLPGIYMIKIDGGEKGRSLTKTFMIE